MADYKQYLTIDEFKTISGIDLKTQLASDNNWSNQEEAFMNRVVRNLVVFVEVKTHKRVSKELEKMSEYQRDCFKNALVEQVLYTLMNGDFTLDSGYSVEKGVIASKNEINNLRVSLSALDYLKLCGLWNATIRNGSPWSTDYDYYLG